MGLGVGFDFAIPKENVAYGGMLSLKYDFGGPTNLSLGALFLFGDYENSTSFMLGVGLDFRLATTSVNYGQIRENILTSNDRYWDKDRGGAGGIVRLGVTTQAKRLYFYTDLTLGGYKAEYGRYDTLLDEEGNVQVVDGRPQREYKTEAESHMYFNFAFGVGYRF